MKLILKLLRIGKSTGPLLLTVGVILSVVASIVYFNPVFMLPFFVKVTRDAYYGAVEKKLTGLL